MGFSVLSIVEIFYFVSMRPYWMNRKEKQKEMGNQKPVKSTKQKKKKFGGVPKIAWMKYDSSGLENYVPFPYTE